MLTEALLVCVEALPRKDAELAGLLTKARTIAMDEPSPVAWFAIQLGPTSFDIYDVLADKIPGQSS